MILNRLDALPRKNGRPFGMAPDIKAHGYGPREDFAVEKVMWRRAERPHVYGPLEAPHFDEVELVCLTCGRSVPSPETHGEAESWRDLAHPVRAYREGER